MNYLTTDNNKKVTKELTALLMGAGGVPFLFLVPGLLLELRPAPSEVGANWLATMTSGGNMPGAPLGISPVGPCQRIEENAAPAWLALYLVAAAGRLAMAERALADGEDMRDTMAKEELYFEKHLAAEERRLRAAALQDAANVLNVDRDAEKTKGLLGWRAVLDNRTTPECRWAHGRNFKADRMPIIGWPGAVHVRCRCSPGPAIPGAPLIESV